MVLTNTADVAISMVNRDMARQALYEVFQGMSPTARYMRYLSATPRLSPNMVSVLSDVDGSRHVAWQATRGGRAVGLVRLHEDQDGIPELAVEVVDHHSGCGIGKQLVSTALWHAAERGTSSVRVLVHPENTSAIRLFRGTGARFVFRAGLLEGTIPVTTSVTVAA